MVLNKKWIQLRDLFAMRSHFGWFHALLGRLRRPEAALLRHLVPIIDHIQERLDQYTQLRSREFDKHFGTDTYGRIDVPVSEDQHDTTRWGYSAINHDFFREMISAIPVSLTPYTFVDIGSGKGAAVLMASEFPFKQLIGVELNAELVDIARTNVLHFNRTTGKNINPEWAVGDFFKWEIPPQPCLFFFNNPFPEALTLQALQHLERMLAHHPYPMLMVFRKAPASSGHYLHRSAYWKALRLAPYWRVYAANHGNNHVS